MTDDGLTKSDDIIRFIGKKWVLLILKELEKSETIRFNELKQSLEITSATLALILIELKNNNMIKKKTHKEFPTRTDYSLTEKGKKIIRFIKQLNNLSQNSNSNNNISFEEKKMNGYLVQLAIETALLKMGTDVLEKVESRLKTDYNCVIRDCLDHPEYLKIILCDLFGESYADILDTIQRVLKEAYAEKRKHFTQGKQVREFLRILSK